MNDKHLEETIRDLTRVHCTKSQARKLVQDYANKKVEEFAQDILDIDINKQNCVHAIYAQEKITTKDTNKSSELDTEGK